MPKVNFSNEDIKAGFLVQNPGRYEYVIERITVKPAKSDGSPNYTFLFKGKSGEMDGVPVFVMISSKAGWLLTPIFKAANGGKPLETGVEYDTDDLVGVSLSAMTTRGQREDGSPFNMLSDYMPIL
jgi:hypothetical protein